MTPPNYRSIIYRDSNLTPSAIHEHGLWGLSDGKEMANLLVTRVQKLDVGLCTSTLLEPFALKFPEVDGVPTVWLHLGPVQA